MKEKSEKETKSWNTVFHFCIMIAAIFGIVLFLFGFLPLKTSTQKESPSSNLSDGLKRSNPVIGRLIFMVIDALRSDFISGPNGPINMPYLTKLIADGDACVFTAQANPPTVTMPRIKAMVTGTVPGFVDIILNLGSSQLSEESFISTLISRGQKAIFYGDDTWLRLFPNSFTRSEGTTSFFVADYTEVDLNVTRHVAAELVRNDWGLMVLHYLGLDHIGHLVGPRSPLVQPKLMEMDAVIQQIHLAAPEDGLPQLLLVCGDHGMKDSGSHGGASQEETHVAVAAVGIPCLSGVAEINQVDLAPTLSLLLGLPEPAGSVGILVPELITSLTASEQLEAHNINTAHLATLLGSSISGKQESLIIEANKLYMEWKYNSTEELAQRIAALYITVASDMSEALAHAHSKFDLYSMAAGAAVVFQSTILLTGSTLNTLKHSADAWIYFTLIIFYVGLNSLICSFVSTSSIMCSFQPVGILVQGSVATILTFSCIKIYCNFSGIQLKFFGCASYWFLIIASILHCLGLGASSFVEEEHQVWYFFWPTLLLLLLRTSKCRVLLLLNLVLHRVARTWNQTGDKWASEPDVGDYLSARKDLTTLVFLLGIISVGVYLFKTRSTNKVTQCFYTVMLILIYLHRTAVGSVHFPYLDHLLSHQGWLEARIFGLCLIFVLIYGIYQAVKINSLYSLTNTFRDAWILGVTLLRRPHDTVLIPVQLLASYTITRTCHSNITFLVIAHNWLGWVVYFYQGNSNSLASVDVAAGYIGLSNYQPVLVGTFLLAHTYSAPVLSQFLLLSAMVQHARILEVQRGLRLSSVLRLMPICMYLGVVAFQREHLFVWSVFAPKLLYEATATLVFLLVMVPCYFCLHLLVNKF